VTSIIETLTSVFEIAISVFVIAISAGCSDYTVLVVDVKNPQALDVTKESVSVTLAPVMGAPMTKTHEFDINGNLGNFSVSFPQSARGQVTVQVTPLGADGNPTGRATSAIAIAGQSRVDLTVGLVRKLAGTPGTLMAGEPGGQGRRDGETGPASKLSARLHRPQAMAQLGANVYILEDCALRRIQPGMMTGVENVDTLVPCRAGANSATSGTLADLVLQHPVTMVGDFGSGRLFISDGPRVVAITMDGKWSVFAPAGGLPLGQATGLALGPYLEDKKTIKYDTLYVADADPQANVIWAYPLSGGTPSILVGQQGPCAPLDPTEAPKMAPVAAAQAHLCNLGKLDVGMVAADPTQWALFFADRGHQALRIFDPNSGVGTLIGSTGDMTAIVYKHFDMPVGIPLVAGIVAFAADNQFGYYTQYASVSMGQFKQGTSSIIKTDGQPGYTEELDLLTQFGSTKSGSVRFDDVEQLYRPLLDDVNSPVLGGVQLALVQAGNAVAQGASGSFHIAPIFGVGPHRGADSATKTAPAFFTPAGLASGPAGSLFVADTYNHAVARVAYDPTQLSAAASGVFAAAGCPGSPGDLDGDAAQSRLRSPRALAWDAQKSDLYVADTGNASLRRLHFDDAGAPVDIHTVLGPDGTTVGDCDLGQQDAGAPAPGFLGVPSLLAFDATRRMLWVADREAAALAGLPVDDASPRLQPLALPAPSVGLAIAGPWLFSVDASGNLVRIDVSGQTPVAVAPLALALQGAATALGSDGEWLYLADDSPRLYRFDPWGSDAGLEILAGDGILGLSLAQSPVGLNQIGGIGYEPQHGLLFFADSVENSVVALQ
jgi:hypothetical protein